MSSNQQQANINADNNNSQNVSGKSKGKQKKKGEKLDVDLFFANTTPNWASMMEDDSENEIIVPSQYNLPEAPKALVNEIDPTQIPTVPPFKVHLRNLHYELEKEDLEGLFRNLTIIDIQMIKDRTIRTAWIEFETKQDLVQALEFNNRSIRGRNISMSLDRGGGGSGDRYGDRRGRGGFGGRDNTSSDWRSRDTMPPKQVYPPPSVDSYDHAPRTGGYSGGGGGGNRGPRRYGDDDYAPPSSHRNDYGGGGYDDRGGDDRSGYDDRYGRRNDYGHRRGNDSGGNMGGGSGGGSNWRRNENRVAQQPEEPSNWRRDVPPPMHQQQDHSSYEQPRGGGRPLRYDDNNVSSRAMLPPRMASDHHQQQQSSYRNDETSGYNDDLYEPSPPSVRNSNQSIDPDMQQSSSRPLRNENTTNTTYENRRPINEQYYQSSDQFRSGNRNPPLMDHPGRERLSSTRSNVSNVDQHSTDDYSSSGGGGGNVPATTAAPKERRPFINSSVLDALKKQAAETAQPAKVSNYSSIFGEAKPVDTTEKELEIEKKLLSSKQEAAAAVSATTNEESNKSNTEQPQDSTNDNGGDVSVPPASNVSVPSATTNDRPNRIEHRDYQNRDHRSSDQDSIPPRRRANGGIGSNRMGGGGGGGMRRDYDDRNNGALSDRRMGGGGGGNMRAPRGDYDRMGSGGGGNNAPRMRRDGPRGDSYINNSSGGGGGYNDRRRFGDRDRIGGRRGYGDDNVVAPRYQDRGPRIGSGGGGGYDNNRNRYNSGGSDYLEWSKDDRDSDSKQISYASTNKFEHLGETDDHGSE